MAVRYSSNANFLNNSTAVLNYNSAYTLMFWLFMSSDPGAIQNPYAIHSGTQNADTLRISAARALQMRVTIGNSSTDATGSIIPATTWQHIAIVRESATVVKVYLNGVLDITHSASNVTGRTAATNVRLGRSPGTAAFDGRMFAAKAWQSALTLADVQAEMNVITPRSGAGYYWLPMFPGSGERARDYSGNGRNFAENGALTDEDPPPVGWGAPGRMLPLVTVASNELIEIVDESVDVDEDAQRRSGLFRQIAEGMALLESILSARTLARLATDTIDINETPARLMAMTRLNTETVDITENVTRLRVYLRSIAETVEVSEATNRLRAYLRAIDETVNITEAAQRLSGLLRSIDETVGITETIVRARALARIVGETVQIDEAINRLKSIFRTVGETVNIAETIVDVLTNVGMVVIRVINETVNIDEAASRLMAMTRQIAETINIDEAILRTRTLARVIDEALNVTETVSRLKAMVRTVAETVDITETIVNVLAAAGNALVRVIDETLNINEVTNRAMSLMRSVSETVGITEAISRAATWIRTINETVNITETIRRVRGMSQVIDESVTITEAVAGILGAAGTLLETTFKGMYRAMFKRMR